MDDVLYFPRRGWIAKHRVAQRNPVVGSITTDLFPEGDASMNRRDPRMQLSALIEPFQGTNINTGSRTQGCAAQPCALQSNPFGVAIPATGAL